MKIRSLVPQHLLPLLRKCRCPICYAPLEAAEHIGERIIVRLTPGSIREIERIPFGSNAMHMRCSAFPQHDIIGGPLGTVDAEEILIYIRKYHKLNGQTRRKNKGS